MNILAWQERKKTLPQIWVVFEENDMANLYDSREAALVHLRWLKTSTWGGAAAIETATVHDLQSAIERFGPGGDLPAHPPE